MNQREYDQLREQIREKCFQDLAALERVYELSQNLRSTEPEKVLVKQEPIKEKKKERNISFLGSLPIRKLVPATYPYLPDEFSCVDVRNIILEKHPEYKGRISGQSITNYLRQNEGTKVELIRGGTGKTRPSIFRLLPEKQNGEMEILSEQRLEMNVAGELQEVDNDRRFRGKGRI